MSVVFETYKENPKNLDGKLSEALEGSEMVNEYLNINLNYDTHKVFCQGRWDQSIIHILFIFAILSHIMQHIF